MEGHAGGKDCRQSDACLPSKCLNELCRNLIFDAAQVVAQTIREVAASTKSRQKPGPEKQPTRDISVLRTTAPVEIRPDTNIPVPVKCVIDAL